MCYTCGKFPGIYHLHSPPQRADMILHSAIPQPPNVTKICLSDPQNHDTSQML